MSENKLGYDDLLRLVKLFESSSEYNEFHLKYGDVEIDLRKQGAAPFNSAANTRELTAKPAFAAQPTAPPTEAREAESSIKSAPPPAAAPAEYPAGAQLVKSPMVGTFYRAPEPGAAPFVTVGQRVTPDSTVCIIEIMKLMNSIPAGFSGVVTHILANNSEPVEYGQVLMVIDPNG